MILEEVIKDRILILDGAMGTMIQRYGLTEADFRGTRFQDISWQMKGNNDVLSLTRPDVVEDIHRKYLVAGADIIETNTFSSQRISMADYHCEHLVKELNKASARIARRLADEFTRQNPEKPRFVAGSIGPTNKTCSMSPRVDDPSYRDVDFDEMSAAYQEQIEALVDAGVDALLIETIFDTLNAKAAIYAAEEVFRQKGRSLPLMLSVTVSDKAGRTLSGQTLEAFLTSVDFAPIFSVGLNCSFGPMEIKPYIEEVAREATCYVSVYPNAGLPNAMGQYDVSPAQMAEQMRAFVDEGLVNIIGGCCGTTDAYIACYNQIIRDENGWKKPHQPHQTSSNLRLSGLERLEVRPDSNFINIGERCNVAGSRKFLRLISEQNYEEAQEIARKQVEDGAQIIDINMDDGLLEGKTEMVRFLNLITSDPDIARVPFMIDSSRWEVILAALKCVQGKCVVNSISLKEGEEKFLAHARDLKSLGAAVVVMAFDEEGQATSYERKISICERAYRLLVDEVNFSPNDIIFDANILTIGTGMAEHSDYALNFIRAAAWIRKHLPGAHVSGGVSNLSFAFRGNNYLRNAMHAVFLYHAIQNGMDMGIVNPSSAVMYEDIPLEHRELIEDLIFNRRPDATERVLSLMQTEAEVGKSQVKDAWEEMSVEERLKQALRKGQGEHLETDIPLAMEKYGRAVSVIEGPLMDGMSEVGKLFADGKMFLPQVVKTARTMKKAVELLAPYMEKEKSTDVASAGKILLATVKGDVHDIGKNIVGVVLACNNYEVIDLGVMMPAEQIVEAALREKVDMIGLSGLITPSLDEMINTVRQLRDAGIDVPVMIGGATTSKLHTALKISPVYNGPVVWVKDAAQNSIVAGKLLNEHTRTQFVDQLNNEYEVLRKERPDSSPLASLEESRKNKLNLFD